MLPWIRRLFDFRSPSRSDYILHGIFDREGVDRGHDFGIRQIHTYSEKLFGFHLAEGDARWRLVAHYGRLRSQLRFSDHDFHAAWQAKYASPDCSGHGRFPSTNSLENTRHVARALANLEIGHAAVPAGSELQFHRDHPDFFVRFEMTKSVKDQPDGRGVMGCPVGLWQLQLYRKDRGKDTYLARVVFNFHREKRKKVITISGMQGAKGMIREFNEAQAAVGENLYAYMIGYVRRHFGNGYAYRGITNPGREREERYRKAYHAAGISECHEAG